MTHFQIAAIAILAVIIAWYYFPALPAWPTKKPTVQSHIYAVLRIRDEATSPEVKEKCSELLQALLR